MGSERQEEPRPLQQEEPLPVLPTCSPVFAWKTHVNHVKNHEQVLVCADKIGISTGCEASVVALGEHADQHVHEDDGHAEAHDDHHEVHGQAPGFGVRIRGEHLLHGELCQETQAVQQGKRGPPVAEAKAVVNVDEARKPTEDDLRRL